MICINIKYGCGHLGVATFAIEILRMSEIALDPHLDLGDDDDWECRVMKTVGHHTLQIPK